MVDREGTGVKTRIASKHLTAGMAAGLFALATLAAGLAYLAPTVYAAFSGSGAGTSGDPYVITTCAQLQEMDNDLDAHYTLGKDIDCSGVAFEPIGQLSPFTGVFDGGGHTISNLGIDNQLLAYSRSGLFATISSGGEVSNVGLINVNTEFIASAGGQTAGMIAGYLESSTVRNVYVTGEITCTVSIPVIHNVGGLVGSSVFGTIENSYSSVNINCASSDGGQTVKAGGLVGFQQSGSIMNSFATGDVSVTGPATSLAGGLIGDKFGGTIENSYSVMDSTVGFGSGAGTEGGDLLSSLYSAGHPVYVGTPPWDFDAIWQFPDSSSLPVLRAEDDDGVASAVEDAAPNNGDANNDNISDSDQSNVASFVNSVSGKYVAVVVSDNCELTSASANAESANAKDAGYDYQTGLINFSATCSTSSTQVKIYQYGIAADNLVLRKHNPNNNSYFTINAATLETQTIGGQTVAVATYTIVDNGELDLNPATGQITDPVGLANLVVGAPNTGLGKQSN